MSESSDAEPTDRYHRDKYIRVGMNGVFGTGLIILIRVAGFHQQIAGGFISGTTPAANDEISLAVQLIFVDLFPVILLAFFKSAYLLVRSFTFAGPYPTAFAWRWDARIMQGLNILMVAYILLFVLPAYLG